MDMWARILYAMGAGLRKTQLLKIIFHEHIYGISISFYPNLSLIIAKR